MIKTLELDLGVLSQQYQAGWYQDSATGTWYWFDGQQWYVYAAGYIFPLGEERKTRAETIARFPYAPIDVAYGDSVMFTCTFKYVGPDWDGYMEGAFGDNSGWFGEAHDTVVKEPKRHIDKTITPKSFTWYITLPVVGGFGNLGEGEASVRIKLTNGAGATQSGVNCSYVWTSVINVITKAEFDLFAITKFEKV